MADFTASIALNAEGNAGSELSKLGQTVSTLIGSLAAMAGVTLGLGAAMGTVVRQGVAFNSQMEDSKLAISGMIQTFMQVGGALVSHDRAMEEAQKAQDALRVAALQTAAQYSELVTVFQTVFPAAVQQGFKVDQVVVFTKTVAQLASAMVLPIQEVASQISLVLGGVIRAEGRIGLLFKNMGVTSDVLASWKAQGTTFEHVMALMKPMADLAPMVAQTWTAAWSNLKDATQQALGAGMVSTFAAAKKAVLDFTGSIVKISGGEFHFDPQLIDWLTRFSAGIAAIIPAVAEVVKGLMGLGAAGLAAIGDTLRMLVPFVDLLALALKALTPLVGTFGSLGLEVWLAVKAVKALEAAFLTAKAASLTLAASNAAYASGGLGGAAEGAAAGSGWVASFTAAIARLLPPAIVAVLAGIQFKAIGEKWGRDMGDAFAQWMVWDPRKGSATVSPEAQQGADIRRQLEAALDQAVISAGAKGLDDLAEKFAKLRQQVGEGLSIPKALEQFHDLGKEGAASLEKIRQASDPDMLRKLGAEAVALRAQFDALGKTGLTKALADVRVEMGKALAGFADKTAGLDPTSDAYKQAQANLAKQIDIINKTETLARRAAADAHQQRLLDLQKQANEIAGMQLFGFDKEIAAIQAGVAEEHAANLEKLKLYQRDDQDDKQARAGIMKLDALQQQLGVQKIAEATRANVQAIEAFADQTSGAWADVYRAQGLELQAGQLEADLELKKGIDAGIQAVMDGTIKTQEELEKYWDVIQAKRDSKNVKDFFAQIGDEVRKLNEQFHNGVIPLAEYTRAMAALQEKAALAQGDGFGAAIAKIQQQVKTSAEIMRDYYVGVWDAIGNGFQNALYGIISGTQKLSDSLKGLWNSILQAFSKMVTDMVQKWIVGLFNMQDVSTGRGLGTTAAQQGVGMDANGNPTASGGTSGGRLNLAGGLAGLGIGASVGSLVNGNNGLQSLLTSIAGTIGGLFYGYLGAIVSSLLTALVGVLMTGQTERKQTISNSPDSPLGATSLATIRNNAGLMSASFQEMFRQVDPTQAAEWTRMLNQSISEYIQSMHFVIHAGSDTDFSNDLRELLNGVIPRALLARLFGLRPTGGEVPGISGSTDQYGGQFDPDAPISRMLAGLGLTAAKIQEIANRVNTEAPDVLMKWLQQFVSVMVRIQAQASILGKTSTQLMADLAAAANETAVEHLRQMVANLEGRGANIANLTGQAQLDAADQLTTDIQAALDYMMQALEAIRQAVLAFDRTVDDLLKQAADALKTPEQRQTDLEATAFGAAAKVANEKTWAGAQQVANEGIAAFQALLSSALAWRQAAEQAVATWQTWMDEMNGVAGDLSTVAGIQAGVAHAATMTGQAQLTEIQRVGNAAIAMWRANEQSIHAIEQMATSLHQSLQESIFQLNLGQMNPQDQATAIGDRIRDLMEQLRRATSPEEVQRLTGEIQRWGGQYIGLFGQNDPNRQAAVDWLNGIYSQADTVSQGLLATMKTALEAANEALRIAMEAAGVIFHDNVTAAGAEVDRLAEALKKLREAFDAAATHFADEITAAAAPLRLELDAMRTALQAVTTALGGESGAGGGGGGEGPGLEQQSMAAAASLGDIVTASAGVVIAFNAIASAGGVAPGEGGGTPGDGTNQPSSYNPGPGSADFIRRYPGTTMNRMGR